MAVTGMTGQAEGVSRGTPWRRWLSYAVLFGSSVAWVCVMLRPGNGWGFFTYMAWFWSVAMLLVLFLVVDRLMSLWWGLAAVAAVVGGVGAAMVWAPDAVPGLALVGLGLFVFVGPFVCFGLFSGRSVAIALVLWLGPQLIGFFLQGVVLGALSDEFVAAADVAREGAGDDHRFWVGPYWFDEFCAESNGVVYFWNDGVSDAVVEVRLDGTVIEQTGTRFGNDRQTFGCWVDLQD